MVRRLDVELQEPEGAILSAHRSSPETDTALLVGSVITPVGASRTAKGTLQLGQTRPMLFFSSIVVPIFLPVVMHLATSPSSAFFLQPRLAQPLAGIILGWAGSRRALGHQSRSLDLEEGRVEFSTCQKGSCDMPKTPMA